ncbi:MAG: NADH-quinone oxidoreductase subunit NuoE family protein, partial [Anaerolineae bacterium]
MACACSKQATAPADFSLVDSIIAEHGAGPGSLIPLLQKTQEAYGYLPRPVLERIAATLHLPATNVFGVATFYAQFRLQPVGKHIIRVCHGTACHVAGADKITEA